ncbi:uPF0102 protein RUMLAC_01999 [Clostridium sp. CAG:411]|nr:YraN family protein [Lachnospiraceae bacterium]CDE45723.1 uPF0102 protein RUMLAC_01999 [Clostridium sp. CAG:411]
MIRQKKRKLGNEKEKIAGVVLQSCGYKILQYNFYTRIGEIDIVAKEGEYYVFVEVKYRSTDAYGMPEEAIDYRKQKRIIAASRYYLMKQGVPENVPCRFDVVCILGKKYKIIKDAFHVE